MSLADDEYDDYRDQSNNDPVEFEDVLFLKESEKAVLCAFSGGTEEHWIPKSQINSCTEEWVIGGESNLIIPKWLAVAKKLW